MNDMRLQSVALHGVGVSHNEFANRHERLEVVVVLLLLLRVLSVVTLVALRTRNLRQGRLAVILSERALVGHTSIVRDKVTSAVAGSRHHVAEVAADSRAIFTLVVFAHVGNA